ncbi:MAG: hypothetical protein N3B18_03995 [Desulfobacterota bacterium]|nr:hypothetical protein [Thermodesulfobacteriota bacterium]
MPHVVLEGAVDLQRFCSEYCPSTHPIAGGLVKLKRAYVSTTADEILIEAVAIEEGHAQRFLVQILVRESRTTVKLYSGIDPEKTEGVKTTVALVARQLKACSPYAHYGATNLGDLLL